MVYKARLKFFNWSTRVQDIQLKSW